MFGSPSRRSSMLALVMAIVACAPRATSSSPSRSQDRSVITREEIAQRSFENIYSVVASLRSDWLRPPLGGTGFAARSATAPPTVYVDGRHFGALELLKTFSAESVERIRYYSATDAQNRFGTAVESPVIEVVSRGRDGRQPNDRSLLPSQLPGA